jgi:predicted permease
MPWPFRRQRDRDLDDEIRAHLSMAEKDRIERGEAPSDARRAVRREFGNVALVKQVTRDIAAWRVVDRLALDVRHAARRLAARPALTALAVVMLGLAVGITTAMFTLVDAFFLRPFPFRNGDRIAGVSMMNKGGGRWAVEPSVFRAWRESAVFEAAEAVSQTEIVLEGPSGPTTRTGAFVTPGLFDMLGAAPVRGRLFDPAEGRAGATDRVIISEDAWRSVFAGDPQIIGRRIALGKESAVVIGLMPRDFRFPEWDTEIWRPLDFLAQPPGPVTLPIVFGKRAATVPADDALRVATAAAHAADQKTTKLWATFRTPWHGGYAGEQYVRAAVRLLGSGVVLVFLVLSTNVSSLLLARFNVRRRDVALSSALGASRGRLVWQALVESALLGGLGAAFGIAVAYALVAATNAILPVAFLTRSLNPLDLDARALGVAAGLAVAATFLAGLLPAWIGTRGASPLQALASRTSTEPRGARLLSRGLLVTEVALACALLVGATLLVRSFVNLSRVDPGFDPGGILSIYAGVDGRLAPDLPARQAAMTAAATELSGLPGVSRVVRSAGVPLFVASGMSSSDIEAAETGALLMRDAQFQMYSVGPGWFEMFGVRLVRGRDFSAGEDPGHVILGARFAASLWPGGDPIGRSFRWGKTVFQVIGIAADLRSPVEDLEMDFNEIYFPMAESSVGSTLSLRCGGTCPSEGVIRQRIAAVAPAVTVYRVARLEDVYREELSQPRLMAAVGMLFGALALVVAAAGLFSVLSHAVSRRRREFGIRLVLGSTPGQIRQLVLREGLTTGALGIGLGAAGGWLATASLAAVLYGVTSSDVLSWTVVVAAVLGATLAGAWHPARLATRIDPGTLLRDE